MSMAQVLQQNSKPTRNTNKQNMKLLYTTDKSCETVKVNSFSLTKQTKNIQYQAMLNKHLHGGPKNGTVFIEPLNFVKY